MYISKKGIIIIALGDAYCEMALNLCLSIRANKSPDIEVMVVHQGLPASVASRASFFTYQVDVTDKIKDIHVNLHRAMYAKLLAYSFSPFDETILLDADTLMLPGNSVSSLFFSCQDKGDFLAMNVGYYERFSEGRALNKYTWWTKGETPIEAATHFMAPIENPIPQINASFLYWKKSPKAAALFTRALKIWNDKTFTGYVEHHRSKTEEFCLNMACAVEGVYPCPPGAKTFFPVFIKMHHENWTEETLHHQYSAFSLAGAELGNQGDYRLARIYNKTVAFYRRLFGISDDYVLHQQTKGRIVRERKCVGYWHVLAMNNWVDVVTEQISIIQSSGLYERTALIKVGFIGTTADLSKFQTIMRQYDKVAVVYHSVSKNVFEFPTLDILKFDADCTEEEYYGYYFHTKGVTKQGDSCKNWRDYMNHYILRLWNKSVAGLDAGYELTGCNWLLAKNTWEDHFSGNFWWFRTNYIKFLPSILSLKREDRYEAEMWVGKASAKVYQLSHKEVNAPNTKKFFPKRKIGVFVSGNLKFQTTLDALGIMGMSGLLEESETAVGCFTPKDVIEQIIPKQSFFTRTEEYATLATAEKKIREYAKSWCEETENGVALLLSIPKEETISAAVIDNLVKEWKSCYHRLQEGYTSVGILENNGEQNYFSANSFWLNAASVERVWWEWPDSVLPIKGKSYFNLPLITENGS